MLQDKEIKTVTGTNIPVRKNLYKWSWYDLTLIDIHACQLVFGPNPLNQNTFTQILHIHKKALNKNTCSTLENVSKFSIIVVIL